MDRYTIKMLTRAMRDLDGAYEYISKVLIEPNVALNLLDSLEQAILSLEELPHRGTPRKSGFYAKKDYRQLFVKNFTLVYRVDEKRKQVIIVTVRYSRSEF